MKIEAVSVGTPRVVRWRGKEVATSIFKAPVDGPVAVRRLNLDGDRQADPGVHGGEYKAIYAYAAEPIHVGDVFCAGSAVLEATEPRLPCYKLGIRFGDPRMVETFATARRWGIYFRVVKEGELQEGDVLERIHRDSEAIPVYDIARVYVFDRGDAAAMQRLSAHPRLDPSWKEHFVDRLASRAAGTGS